MIHIFVTVIVQLGLGLGLTRKLAYTPTSTPNTLRLKKTSNPSISHPPTHPQYWTPTSTPTSTST